MVALNFLRFWRPSSVSTTIVEVGGDEEEEEESFFDLELSVSSVSGEKQSNLVFAEQPPPTTTTHDVFSKRKVNPIEPLTSSPSPKPRPSISPAKSSPALTGVNGSKPEKKRSSGGRELALSGAIQKYLKRIKPRKSSDKPTSYSFSSMASPALARGSGQFAIRAVCKNLGKSKSSSAAVGTESPARRDDSLIQQNDNIQSAILHCKRSFNSSRVSVSESSMLSRSSSDSIKSMTSDCSVLSRWIDSARSSSEERSSVS